MDAELKLFDNQDLEQLTEAECAAIYRALQAVFSPRLEDRLAGIAQIRSLDGHLRSPLVASALAHRVHEPDLKLLGQVVELLVSVIRDAGNRQPAELSRKWTSHALGHLGQREIENLLKLLELSDAHLTPVAKLLNECSLAGDILVKVFTDGKRELNQRIMAIRLIDEVGFLEAVPMIEHWIIRLTSRQERQLRMSFAPAPDPETAAILPALRQALISLKGGELG